MAADKAIIIIVILAVIYIVGYYFVLPMLYSMGFFMMRSGQGSSSSPGRVGPCSPCFPVGSDFMYLDHNADTLVVRTGPSEITDTRVVVGGSATDIQTEIFEPGDNITYLSDNLFAGDNVEITIEYRNVETGEMKSTTATLHGAEIRD